MSRWFKRKVEDDRSVDPLDRYSYKKGDLKEVVDLDKNLGQPEDKEIDESLESRFLGEER